MSSSLNRAVKFVVAALLLGAVALVNASGADGAAKGVPGTAKADSLKACVRPTDWMRRNHMELIKHARDQAVRQGIRVKEESLANCIDCHARKDGAGHYVPVDRGEEFCNGCHAYVGEHLPCFQCHATVPSAEQPK